MTFDLEKSIAVLERTPAILKNLLAGLPEDWLMNNEGDNTFSPFDVAGHYLHGEKTDWMARVEIIMAENENKKFATFDRFAQFEESKGKTLDEILDEFQYIREKNIQRLRDLGINEEKLNRTGIHPKFGEVTLRQLLSTWVIHDLTHLAQISRVMASQYKTEMGPWLQYFRMLQ